MLTHWWSTVADTPVIIGTAFVVGLVMRLVWKRWVEPLLVWAAVALQSAVFLTTTLLVSRERPDVEKLDPAPPTSSFPSGHTGASTALYLSIGLVLAGRVRSRVGRVAVVVLLLLVPIGVGVSRLYRGMHFPTDVVFGALNGIVGGAGGPSGGPRLAGAGRPHRLSGEARRRRGCRSADQARPSRRRWSQARESAKARSVVDGRVGDCPPDARG